MIRIAILLILTSIAFLNIWVYVVGCLLLGVGLIRSDIVRKLWQ